MTAADEGYLSYVEFTGLDLFTLHLVRIKHSRVFPRRPAFWHVENEAFRRSGISIRSLVNNGTRPDGSPLLKWLDGIPTSFAVGDLAGGPHLYLAWRQLVAPQSELDEAEPSVVFLADCIDVPRGRCNPTDAGVWRIRRADSATEMQYQPFVTADPDSRTMALAWYQGAIPPVDPSLRRWTMHGIFSENGSDTLSAINLLRPDGIDWEICPRSDGYYGDYVGSVIVPGLRHDQKPWIVTAHSDSTYSTLTPTGCEQTTDFTRASRSTAFDQHVQAVVW